MATFDISRVTFDPAKHYSSVRMQQGRVLLDDDWNENERIDAEERRRSRGDIIGWFGSPNDGFRIKGIINNANNINFGIAAGTLHLGGLRLELESDEEFLTQSDNLVPELHNLPGALARAGRYDLVYIEAWQQPVSAVEDSSLFEPALSSDTTTRMRTMRVVHIQEDIGADNCQDAWKAFIALQTGTLTKEHRLRPDVKLKVVIGKNGVQDDPCSPKVAGGYFGAENQAIRVQLADPGHFTWGFDNASPYYRVTVQGGDVTMVTEPRDQYHQPRANQVVEILSWSAELPNGEKVAGQTGFLAKVNASYNPVTKKFTIAPQLPAEFPANAYYYLRVWNRGTDQSQPQIPFNTGVQVDLGNTGLAVVFNGTEFLKGDHWVIAARPNTPDKVLPAELLGGSGMGPMGVNRFLAPLGIIHWTTDQAGATRGTLHDCRKLFRPLTSDDCCCTYTVGDGRRSMGDYNSIQAAIDNLPPEGGKICVLRGYHRARVRIYNRKKIRIIGCNEHTIIVPGPGNGDLAAPLFNIRSSDSIHISNLTMTTYDGTCISVTDTGSESSSRITIDNNGMTAVRHAIRVKVNENKQGENEIRITNNRISMVNKTGGGVAIYALADDVLIENNKVIIIPDREQVEPGNEDIPEPNDPCLDTKELYKDASRIGKMIRMVALRVRKLFPFVKKQAYFTEGGIQIGGSSERVRIVRNEITGGNGNGITLGDATRSNAARKLPRPSFLYEIQIIQNRIMLMGGSGIGVKTLQIDDEDFQVTCEGILIHQNHIRLCTHSPRKSSYIVRGGVSLGICEGCAITQNEILDNGNDQTIGVSGIFVYYGDRIDISGNHIYNNGADTVSDRTSLCGGIVVSLTMQGMANMLRYMTRRDSKFPVLHDADPVIKIQSNMVTHAAGNSLMIVACGPIMVSDNQLTSQGVANTRQLNRLAGNVFIMNLGLPHDYLVIQRVHDHKLLNGMGKILQFFPSGKVMFSGNQTTLDARGEDSEFVVSGHSIFTLDDISFQNNQCECRFIRDGKNVPIFTNTMLGNGTFRFGDNRLTDSPQAPVFSLFASGKEIVIGNQATHCLIVNNNAVLNGLNTIFDNTHCV